MKRYIAAGVLVAVVILGMFVVFSNPHVGMKGSFVFAAPSSDDLAFPKDQAGISAYVKVSHSIDLKKVGELFSQLEDAGNNYVIGTYVVKNTIRVKSGPGPGQIDTLSVIGIPVHVYVDTNGWIVAYLKRGEPFGNIVYWGDMDLENPEIKETTLSMAIKAVCDKLGIPYDSIRSNIRYYDFQNPDANGLLMFAVTFPDAHYNTSEQHKVVNLKIPESYKVFNAGYSTIRCCDFKGITINGQFPQPETSAIFVYPDPILSKGSEYSWGIYSASLNGEVYITSGGSYTIDVKTWDSYNYGAIFVVEYRSG